MASDVARYAAPSCTTSPAGTVVFMIELNASAGTSPNSWILFVDDWSIVNLRASTNPSPATRMTGRITSVSA